MRTLLNNILSLIILLQSLGFNVNSLVQIDDLWSHYQEHKIEYGDTLLTFLDLHYGSQQQEHQDEHPEHQDLPTQQCSHIHFTYFAEAKDFNFDMAFTPENAKHNFGYSASFSSLTETDILQPPKTRF
jgi:hypothetical protein